MNIDRHASSVARRATRKAEAQARQEGAAQLTPEERLTVLDTRLGKDQGAVKERLRLHGLIARGGRGPNVTEVLFEGPSEPGEAPKKLKAKDRRAKDKKLNVRQ